MAQPDAALLQDLSSRFILNVPAEELKYDPIPIEPLTLMAILPYADDSEDSSLRPNPRVLFCLSRECGEVKIEIKSGILFQLHSSSG